MSKLLAPLLIALLISPIPAFAQGSGVPKQPGKLNAGAATPESIPWPFTINQNSNKVIKGQLIQYGNAVPSGTSVTVEAESTEEPAHRFASQLNSDNWKFTDMPKQQGVLWGKTATRGPWEAVIISQSSKALKAPKPEAGKVAQAASHLWRTTLEVRLSKNQNGSEPPFKEFQVAPH